MTKNDIFHIVCQTDIYFQLNKWGMNLFQKTIKTENIYLLSDHQI